MPKVIENLKDKLLEEARKQIEQIGFGAMTVQSVAKACGVGVGTVYNYFSSKDDILAQYIAMDWDNSVAEIRAASESARSCDEVLRCIYEQGVALGARHREICREETAAVSVDAIFFRGIDTLSRRVAQPLRRFCKSDTEAQIIAEAMLAWIRTGKRYEEIHEKIVKLF